MKRIFTLSLAPLALLLVFALSFAVHPAPTAAQSIHEGRLFNCVVAASTATTLQAVGGDCGNPAADQALYITDINFGSSAASGTAADSMPTIKSGSGTTCATGTAVIWLSQNSTTFGIVENRATPLRVAAGQGLCWIDSTAGTKTLVIAGYIGSGS